MKSAQDILTEISAVTRKIENKYPELQKYLSETRSTLPNGSEGSGMDTKDLEDYLNGLKDMIKKYEAGQNQ